MEKKKEPIHDLRVAMKKHGAKLFSKHLEKERLFINRLSQTDDTVLIQGPTGTGKEYLAKSIHDMSKRFSKKFIPVNSGGLNEGTLAADLFGYVKGAFTGAVKKTPGAIERANGGTLFLDEIGDLPPKIQIALLRFLNDKSYQRLGEIGVDRKSDVRIICATNKDLWYEVKKGNFREDLFYRINRFPINSYPIAPLNEKRAKWAIMQIAENLGYKQKDYSFTQKAFELLVKYSYPGNYRQMESILHYALVKSAGDPIRPEHLPDYLIGSTSHDIENELLSLSPAEFKRQINQLIFERFNTEYNKTGNNYSQAAKSFGFDIGKFKRILDKSRIGVVL